MARYVNDQNKVLGIHESGTYASPMAGSAFWIGLVQSNTIDDVEGKVETRYLGAGSRSFIDLTQTIREVTGTITYNPQDMRLMFWAIGSTARTSGTNNNYLATQIGTDVQQSPWTSGALNPPVSFTLEDSKQAPGTGRNFIRTVRGAIPNTATLTISQGEKAVMDIEYQGQTLIYSSGTTTSGGKNSNPSYIFGDTALTMFGSSFPTAKEIVLEVNNNLEGPHYLNGSRDISTPFLGNQDVTLTVTMDWDSTVASAIYEEYFKGGSNFNAVIDLNKDTATGSQHAIFTLSGCQIQSMGIPSEVGGVTESTMEIKVQNIQGQEYSTVVFNPGFN